EATKARYQGSIGEKRQVRYFIMSDQEAESKVTVDTADLQRYYSANQDAYRLPERARVRHILIKLPAPGPDGKVDPKAGDAGRRKASDILKQIRGGGDSGALAKKESVDRGRAEKGGEIGWMGRAQTSLNLKTRAFRRNRARSATWCRASLGFT